MDDTEIEEDEFHQYKTPILKIDIDNNKIVVPKNFYFAKQDFTLLVTKILIKLDLYSYSVSKYLYIKEVLMKIDMFIF